jgi:hypothetical protein
MGGTVGKHANLLPRWKTKVQNQKTKQFFKHQKQVPAGLTEMFYCSS